MNIASLETAPTVPVPFDARRLFGNGILEIIHIRLEPGQQVPLHDNPDDVLFYVLEGTGDLTVAEQRQQLGADHLIAIPSGVRRGWANSSKQPLRLLVVKLPNQTAGGSGAKG